ncbi:hypothetical protein [Dongia sp.]|uniref:hypothetical protein n=1 Tax=Dongia sp. TaxID=1977262 RepID=UPI0037510BA6
MKTRFALFSTAVALAGAAFGLHATAAAAQSVSGSIYYGPAPQPVYVQPQVVYVEPQPVYVVPPAYYYPPAPTYYYAPAPVYYPQPSTWAPGISASFDFGGGKRGGHHGQRH